jgi:uncharacterized protein YceH (UPF0502 family)
MEKGARWWERLDHWSRRGGFLTSRQDVTEIVGPLEQRVAALEREVERLRAKVDSSLNE